MVRTIIDGRRAPAPLLWCASLALAAAALACSDDAGPGDAPSPRDGGPAPDASAPTPDAGAPDAGQPDAGQDAGDSDAGPVPEEGFGDVLSGAWSRDFVFRGAAGAPGAGIRRVEVVGDTIYAAGYFTHVSGTPAKNVARWDGTSWSALGEGVAQYVTALAWDEDADRLYASGFHVEGGGEGPGLGVVTGTPIRAWDGAAWSDFARVDGSRARVHVIRTLSDGRIAVGGEFETIDGVDAVGFALWDGASWSTLGTEIELGDSVHAIHEADDGGLCLGGGFGVPDGVQGISPRFARGRGVICWDEVTSTWLTPIAGLPPGRVLDLLSDGPNGELIAAGEFTYFEQDEQGVSVRRAGLARWDGAMWSVLGGGVDGGDINRVRALERAPDGGILVAGQFAVLNPGPDQVRAGGLAKWGGSSWKALGSAAPPIEPVATGWAGPYDLALNAADDLVAAGIFLKIGSGDSSGIAVRDRVGTWKALADPGVSFQGLNGPTFQIAPAQGGTYVAGDFDRAGDAEVSGLGFWDGSRWSELPGNLDGVVIMMKVDADDELWVVGSFTLTQGGNMIRNIARFDGARWHAVGEGAPDALVTDVVLGEGGAVSIVGMFESIGGVSAKHVARFDGSSWSQLGEGLEITDDLLNARLEPGPEPGTLWASGRFIKTGSGTQARRLAYFDGASWSEAGGGLPESANVWDIQANDRGLWVAGTFKQTNDGTRLNSIGLWDGEAWRALGDGLTKPNNAVHYVSAIEVSGDQVIATGTSRFDGPGVDPNSRHSHLTFWDGSKWSLLGGGISDLAFDLAVHGETLWVAGLMTAVQETIPSLGFAQWSWGADAP